MKRTTFINKYTDSGNVAQSTHEERRLINERNREHRKPQQAKKNSPKKKNHDPHSTKFYDGHTAVATTIKAFLAEKCYDDVPIVSANDGLSVLSNEAPPSSPSMQSVGLQVVRSPGNTIDPFDASTISPNDTIIQLLRYYKQIYYNTMWNQVRHAFDGNISYFGVTRCPPEEIILECMQNRARIYTMLANLACQLKYTHKDHSQIETEPLIHKAVQAFREEFRNNARVNGDMFCNALHLYLAVSAIDQIEAAKAHLNGLLAIIQRIIDQGDRIIKPQAALLAIIDPGLAKRLLLDPTRVCERAPKPLGAADVKYLKSKGYTISNGREVLV